MREASLDFLRTLVDTPSPSGAEGPVARLYHDYVAPYADRVTTDVHGNVMAIINPDAPMKIMLAGHLDEIGFVIHHISEEGLLHFTTIGGQDSLIPTGQTVWVHGRRRVAGAVGRKAIHLLGEAERQKKPSLKELWIDIGASSRAEAEAVVRIGDISTYQHQFQPLLGDRAVARAFDNKAGLFAVAEALRLLREEDGLHPGVGVFALGTVQEEIGSRGARTAAFGIGAQTGLAVDMDHALDYPGVSGAEHGQLDIGKGPSILRGANANRVVFDLLCTAAREERIPFQVQVMPGASPTDANAMQLSGPGMATGLLGVPLRYMHTPCEVLSLKDVEDCARLVAAYCRRVRPDTDFTPW
jgi:endoglucanase